MKIENGVRWDERSTVRCDFEIDSIIRDNLKRANHRDLIGSSSQDMTIQDMWDETQIGPLLLVVREHHEVGVHEIMQLCSLWFMIGTVGL